MKKTTEDLIQFRLERSADTINEAMALAALEHWNGAVNRLYYAAFYAVSALLLRKDVYTKSHSGLKSKFHQELILTEELSKEYGVIFDQLFDLRGNGDYGDFIEFDKTKIEPLIEKMEKLINEIKKLIK